MLKLLMQYMSEMSEILPAYITVAPLSILRGAAEPVKINTVGCQM